MKKFFIADLFSDENVEKAISFLETKNSNSCGIDGVKISDIRDYWLVNKEEIFSLMERESFKYGRIKQYEIISPKGKRRNVVHLNTIDRLILKVVSEELTNRYDNILSDSCFSYRTNRGTVIAADRAASFMEAGKIWCAEVDLENYFDSIPHDRLIAKTKAIIKDPLLQYLILQTLECVIEDDEGIYNKKKGILQGNPVSPFLSNLYLLEFDHYLEDNEIAFCRYGDDINAYFETEEMAREGLAKICYYLEQVEQLPINSSKSGVYNGLNRIFLGYEFQQNKKEKEIIVKRASKGEVKFYNNWHTSAIQKIDHNYHIINDGIITKKDYTVLFENEEKKMYIPVEVVDTLYIYSNITFGSAFFEFAGKRNLNVVILDKYGEKIGGFTPAENRRSLTTELKQIEIYSDGSKRLDIAKKLEISGISNLRSNVRYYLRRNKSDQLQSINDDLTKCITDIKNANNINELLLIEARAHQTYYQSYNIIMKDPGFLFRKRTRRPPEDPLNAMLSFGNTLLYQRIASEIYHTSLNIRLAFLHSAEKRSENLNLDLADLFKPILVDRMIFTLVNKKMISSSKHFVAQDGEGVFLNKEGKKIVIEEFENKLYQKTNQNGQMRTYSYLLKNEIKKLQRYINSGGEYHPYKYVN